MLRAENVYGNETASGKVPKNCGYGFHWSVDPDLDGECFCVRDYQENCMVYNLNLGICRKCDANYNMKRTPKSGKVCM